MRKAMLERVQDIINNAVVTYKGISHSITRTPVYMYECRYRIVKFEAYSIYNPIKLNIHSLYNLNEDIKLLLFGDMLNEFNLYMNEYN